MHTGDLLTNSKEEILSCLTIQIQSVDCQKHVDRQFKYIMQKAVIDSVEDAMRSHRGKITKRHKQRKRKRNRRAVVLDATGIHAQIPVSDKFILAQASSFSQKLMSREIFSLAALISVVRASQGTNRKKKWCFLM